MKTINYPIILWLCRILCGAILIIALAACEKESLTGLNESDLKVNIAGENPDANNSKKVVIKSEGMSFTAPEEIQSGWNTFRYENGTSNPHFFVIEKLPAGKTVEDSKAEVVPVFQEGMDLIEAGLDDEALAVFFSLPAWYWEVVLQGGPGLVSPGTAAESTVYMTPGDYVIECYVKTGNGIFHSTIGMIEGIHVSEETSKIKEPESTLDINISSTSGIQFKSDIRPGQHVVSVYFEDQVVHEHFLGHDVHLVKLSPEADIDALNAWMNWKDPDQFKTPAPEGVEFLGGMQELPAGETGYFTAILKPGTYAFISEVPDPMSKNMFKIFEVPQNQSN
ncbi:hypothetical protein [Gramella sp. KN1008]|uniref:hypothetical protein n=1 Tax=Gramella sp. KN1008 TaxID=2529298 RepID=UPI00103C4197|nr:hypothetical protein [Gramella sp. KN1008]TBW27121.1 hypothetical protein EZJ28_12485 [Gramella sp. KN1008]